MRKWRQEILGSMPDYAKMGIFLVSVSVECDLGDQHFEEELSAAAHRIFDERREPWHITARNAGTSINILVETQDFNRAATLAVRSQKAVSYIESLFLKWVGEFGK